MRIATDLLAPLTNALMVFGVLCRNGAKEGAVFSVASSLERDETVEVDMRHPNDVHFWVKADDGSVIDESFVFLELGGNYGLVGNVVWKEWDVIPPYYQLNIATKAAEFDGLTHEQLYALLKQFCIQRGQCLACAVLKQKLEGGTVVAGSVGVQFRNKDESFWHHGNGKTKCDDVYACEAPNEDCATNVNAWAKVLEFMHAEFFQ